MRLKELQSRAVVEHGELALITVDNQQAAIQERITLRPPMLQVVRLASFQHAPSIPPFLTLPKQNKVDSEDSPIPKEFEERRVNEVAVGGGGVAVAVTRFPAEQKLPIGPFVVVGVRDGVLWLIDRYMCAHAISLSHPGIRCRCLAAYGDAVSAVKWASRLGREHHDDLAQFMLGMGYATEALHLPGISKRLEFDLAMQSNDLKRALQCLLTMSNSRDIGQEALGLDLNDTMNLSSKKENVVDALQGVVKFAKEFLDLIDAADATGQADIAREALKRLAAAGSVKGALQGHELRELALRLGNHGELTRLSNLVNNLVSVGSGREAAFATALLGDNVLMEKAWQDTGMLPQIRLFLPQLKVLTSQNSVPEVLGQTEAASGTTSGATGATEAGTPDTTATTKPTGTDPESSPPAQSEPDASATPVADPTVSTKLNGKTVESQERASSSPLVSEAKGIDGSIPPAFKTSSPAADSIPQQSNHQGPSARPEFPMIDFT